MADSVVATDPSTTAQAPGVASERRLEGRVGMVLGGSDVGDADGFSIGVTSGLGYRVGDATLRARLDHYRVGDGRSESIDGMSPRRGRATRVGGALRYALVSSYNALKHSERKRGSVAVELWAEGGLGLEHVGWKAGGVLDRPSGELAIGFDVDGFGAPNERQRRRHIGYSMAFRTLIAQGPSIEAPAMCGGPCDKPTRPSRTDVSMFFDLSVHWGR
jgi:hypothetical protein